MKNIISLLVLFLISACNSNDDTLQVNSSNIILFDSLKAEKFGADEYGMKQYVIAFLKKGPNRDQDSVKALELQKSHLRNITKMAEEGTLVLAGPFLDDEDVRGIYIFDVKTIEEAKVLTETDPAIQVGRLIMDLRPWYGTAALKEINDIHKTLKKNSDTSK